MTTVVEKFLTSLQLIKLPLYQILKKILTPILLTPILLAVGEIYCSAILKLKTNDNISHNVSGYRNEFKINILLSEELHEFYLFWFDVRSSSQKIVLASALETVGIR